MVKGDLLQYLRLLKKYSYKHSFAVIVINQTRYDGEDNASSLVSFGEKWSDEYMKVKLRLSSEVDMLAEEYIRKLYISKLKGSANESKVEEFAIEMNITKNTLNSC